jgi:hypothetical protein
MTTRTETIRARKAEKKAHQERMEAIYAENRAIVATGKCPHCNRGLRRNLSLTGWWQCEQYGAEHFRKDASQPECTWQGFTCFG